jgi:hypothetical protein
MLYSVIPKAGMTVECNLRVYIILAEYYARWFFVLEASTMMRKTLFAEARNLMRHGITLLRIS